MGIPLRVHNDVPSGPPDSHESPDRFHRHMASYASYDLIHAPETFVMIR